MKTEVILRREFLNGEVRQKSKSEFFSATDLVNIGNFYRKENGLSNFNLSQYFNLNGTKEFIGKLEKKYGKVIIKGRGRNSTTWVHPFIFIDIAMSINPDFKIFAYEWIYDHLVRYRNESGDSYKKMAGAIAVLTSDKKEISNNIKEVAKRIKNHIGVEDWESATEEQLKRRDELHNAIFILSDVLNDIDIIFAAAIKKVV